MTTSSSERFGCNIRELSGISPSFATVVVNDGRTVDTVSATASAVIRAIMIAAVVLVILGRGGAAVRSVSLTAMIAAGGWDNAQCLQ